MLRKKLMENSKPSEPDFIPESAIAKSEEARQPARWMKQGGAPRDKYSEEKVSPDQPSHAEVHHTKPDTNVLPG